MSKKTKYIILWKHYEGEAEKRSFRSNVLKRLYDTPEKAFKAAKRDGRSYIMNDLADLLYNSVDLTPEAAVDYAIDYSEIYKCKEEELRQKIKSHDCVISIKLDDTNTKLEYYIIAVK